MQENRIIKNILWILNAILSTSSLSMNEYRNSQLRLENFSVIFYFQNAFPHCLLLTSHLSMYSREQTNFYCFGGPCQMCTNFKKWSFYCISIWEIMYKRNHFYQDKYLKQFSNFLRLSTVFGNIGVFTFEFCLLGFFKKNV